MQGILRKMMIIFNVDLPTQLTRNATGVPQQRFIERNYEYSSVAWKPRIYEVLRASYCHGRFAASGSA